MSDRDDETGEVRCSCGDHVYIEKMCMCEEIIMLRAELSTLKENVEITTIQPLRERIEELEKLERFNYEEFRKLLMDDGKHIVTTEQISRAWKIAHSGEPYADDSLYAMGIVACPECGGSGHLAPDFDYTIDDTCPRCNGEGWVIETPNSATSRDTGVKMSPLNDKCRHNHTTCEDQRSIAIEDIYTDAETGREYATLHFYAGDPDSMAQLHRCLNAERVLWAVQEFDQWLRSIAKHKDLADVAADALMNARQELHQCFTDRQLRLWDE